MSNNTKNNFYVRLTEDNKAFIVNETKRLGITQNGYFNMIISAVRVNEALKKESNASKTRKLRSNSKTTKR